ncbi:hypothetical protein C0J52_20224 [Blattella germanica]|nr:hypothetical protein C0J52_20224 [Blattella germanica]
MGYLDVVVPPDFVNEDTSGDVMVPEGGVVKLTCRARGYPVPHVLWRREDNADLVIKEPSGAKTKVASFSFLFVLVTVGLQLVVNLLLAQTLQELGDIYPC